MCRRLFHIHGGRANTRRRPEQTVAVLLFEHVAAVVVINVHSTYTRSAAVSRAVMERTQRSDVDVIDAGTYSV